MKKYVIRNILEAMLKSLEEITWFQDTEVRVTDEDTRLLCILRHNSIPRVGDFVEVNFPDDTSVKWEVKKVTFLQPDELNPPIIHVMLKGFLDEKFWPENDCDDDEEYD